MTAQSLAKHGVKVAVNDIDEDIAGETVSQIENEEGEAMAAEEDVSDADAVNQMVDQVVEGFGTVDILVNSAGIGGAGPFPREKDNSTLRNEFQRGRRSAIHRQLETRGLKTKHVAVAQFGDQ
nr:SDR family NAD(P)-dependent oxidoreductase [Halomarina sp. PSR21]